MSEKYDFAQISSPGDTILLVLAGYEDEKVAASMALVIAEYFGSNLHVFHLECSKQSREEIFHQHKTWLKEHADSMNVPFELTIMGQFKRLTLKKAVLDQIEKLQPKLTIMMDRHRGFFYRFFGSVAEQIARNCPTPMLVIRSKSMLELTPEKKWTAEKILVPIGSGTPSELAAVQLAIAIAQASEFDDAEITLLHVVTFPETIPINILDDRLIRQEEKQFVKLAGELQTMLLSPMVTQVVVGRDIGRSVQHFAKKNDFDIIVLGVPYLPQRFIGLYGTDTNEIIHAKKTTALFFNKEYIKYLKKKRTRK